MAASVVRVHHRISLDLCSTGFVCYSGQGRCLVMTVADAVGPRRSYHTIGLPNQRDSVGAQVLHLDRGTNLALLSCSGNVPGAALEFANWITADLDSGPVVARGYYLMGRGEFLVAPGVFRGDIRGDAVWRSDVLHTLRCDYPAADGLEGAPVIKAAEVIGVHTGSDGRLQLATSVVSVWKSVYSWLGRPDLQQAGINDMLEMIAAAS